MSSARPNRDSRTRPQGVDPAPLRSALRATRDGTGGPAHPPLGIEARQRLVLSILVEEFGGETTAAALTRHLSRQLGWMPSAPGAKLIEVLQTLHRLGALSLEINGDDFIVRLLPDEPGYDA